jgi:hypothetical protein
MGFLSSVWHAIKGVGRVLGRLLATGWGLIWGMGDFLLGFLTWPPKKLRYQVFILSDEKGPVIDPAAVQSSIDFFTKTYKDRFNVKVIPYGKPGVQILEGVAPKAALDVSCGGGALSNEFGEAGDFFAKHLAGWNVIPISLTFPVSIFIVRSMIGGADGCSIGPLSDYVTMTPSAVSKLNVMAHETGHSCSLWHSGSHSNLMWHDASRGNEVKWFQKNLLRSSRHVQYF